MRDNEKEQHPSRPLDHARCQKVKGTLKNIFIGQIHGMAILQ
jgi:hypothetical protein